MGDIGSTDIHDSLNFASELFKPYPVYGAEYYMTSLERFSAFRGESADGREVKNKYSFELKFFLIKKLITIHISMLLETLRLILTLKLQSLTAK